MLCAKERAELLTAVGFTEQQAASFNDVLFSSGGALAEAGIPADLLAALNDWHTATWYTVEDQDDYQVHSVGVKPKDTLADIIFACCFARFSQATYTCPPTRGVGCHYHHCPPGPSFHASPLFLSKCAWCLTGLPCCFPLSPTWHSRCFPELPDLISPAFFDLPLLPPAFHDDFFVHIAADSPTLLLHNLVRVADIVHDVAQQRAMKLQFAEGETEAVLHLRGRGEKAAIEALAARKPSDVKDCIAALPLAWGEHLRVVTNYTNVGTIAAMNDSAAQDLAHRTNAAQAAEKSQAARLLGAARVPTKCKQLVVSAIHSSLLYAAVTWGPLFTQSV